MVTLYIKFTLFEKCHFGLQRADKEFSSEQISKNVSKCSGGGDSRKTGIICQGMYSRNFTGLKLIELNNSYTYNRRNFDLTGLKRLRIFFRTAY
jgi:hypothetical protein